MQEEEQEIFMPPCSYCGADGHYRQWRDTADLRMKVVSDAHRVLGSSISVLVCVMCGNTQLFVNPDDFDKEQKE